MAAITDLSDLVTLLTDGSAQHPSCNIDNRVGAGVPGTMVTTTFSSLWRYNKSNGQSGAIPGAAAVPTNTTLGSFQHANASGLKELWLLGFEGMSTAPGVLILYDRLLHSGGLSGLLTSEQAVGGAITRNVGGVGNEIWIEIYGMIGSTSTTITANYTNQAGVSKTTPPTPIGGGSYRDPDRHIRMSLADGDTGVQSVTGVTLAASTTSAGNFGVTIARPLVRGFVESGGACFYRDLLAGTPALPKIESGACLALTWLSAGTSAPRLDVCLHMVEK